MKGFIKILEAIIASLILLVSLTFFFTPTLRPSLWDEATLHLSAMDAINTMHASGSLQNDVRNDNYADFNNRMFNLLPKTVDFYAEVLGIPKSTINVLCICSSSQLDNFQKKIGSNPFFYHDRLINIVFGTASNLDDASGKDIVLYLDYTELSDDKNRIISLLKNNTGFVMVANLNTMQINDGVMNDIFDLSAGSIGTGSAFLVASSPGHDNARIEKYYRNISSTEIFSYVPQIVALDSEKSIASDATASYMKLNLPYGGRTVWSAHSTDASLNATYVLIKSSFMWASGERYILGDKKISSKDMRSFGLVVYDKDPYSIVLHIWRVFR